MGLKVNYVGVVGEVKRYRMNDHRCASCCVFGVDRFEFAALKEAANGKISPPDFNEGADRYLLYCSVWTAMRALGAFGYHFPAMPLGGPVESGSDEADRKVGVWTMVSLREEDDEQ